MSEEDRKFYKWALEKVLNFEANDTFVFKKVRGAVI